MEKIKLKITTKQTIDEAGNEDVIELVTEAVKDIQDDLIIIKYDESDITENRLSKTKIRIYKNKLIMTKVGDISSRMEFEENTIYKNIYSTPYGNFDLEFKTLSYNNTLDEYGRGSIYIEYKIIFGGSDESLNKIIIDIF